MGLLTVELMNRIRKELDEEFGTGEKLLYGEPWRATDSPMEEGTLAALKINVAELDENVAIFSDDTRDVIKGHVFFEEIPGFVNGGKGLEERILGATTSWCDQDGEFKPKSPAQIINYVSAHDNFTLWDKLVLSMHGGYGVNNEYREGMEPLSDMSAYTDKKEDVLEANKLAAFIYFTCQGHIFMQAGEEFGRTKFGDGNSYRSDPKINMLRWHQTIEFADLLAYYEGLIRLRKKLPGLCDKTAEAPERIFEKKAWGEGVVSFRVDNTEEDGKQDAWKELFVVYNANAEAVTVNIPQGAWTILADKYDSDCIKEIAEQGVITVAACSGMMLAKK
jgi:pullulanase/glycogen debranching enzyme